MTKDIRHARREIRQEGKKIVSGEKDCLVLDVLPQSSLEQERVSNLSSQHRPAHFSARASSSQIMRTATNRFLSLSTDYTSKQYEAVSIEINQRWNTISLRRSHPPANYYT